jgi:hypothetical protein
MCTDGLPESVRHREESTRSSPQESDDEDPKNLEGTSGKDLCHALVNGSETFGIGITRWKAHHLGCVHNQQSSRHTSEIIVGHDLRLCPKWELRRLWWSGQHLLHLQSQFKS